MSIRSVMFITIITDLADHRRPSPAITIHHWSTITDHRDHRHPSLIDHHRPSRPSPKDFSAICFYGLLWPSRPSPTITNHRRPSPTFADHHRPSPTITVHHRPSWPSPNDISTNCYYGLLWPSRPSPIIADHHRHHRDNHLKTSLRSVITVSYDHRDHHLTTSLRTVIMVCYGHRDHHIKTSLRSVFTACLPTPSRSRIGRWTGYLKPILL